jgi:hypothetical protein
MNLEDKAKCVSEAASQSFKDEVAERIALDHFAVDSGVSRIFRYRASSDLESDPKEPIKLLEVYDFAIPSGIVPVYLPPHLPSGIPFTTEIVQIAPEEYEKIGNELTLPDEWSAPIEYTRPADAGSGNGPKT